MDTVLARRAWAALALAAACAWAPAWAFHLTDVQGQQHTLERYRGKWIVLNVWATWCAPCIKEMPELEGLSHARGDVVVLGLAADGDSLAKIRRYAEVLHVTYPIIAGDPQLLAQFRIKAYPTTLLFDPAGTLVLTRLGQLTRKELESHLPPPT